MFQNNVKNHTISQMCHIFSAQTIKHLLCNVKILEIHYIIRADVIDKYIYGIVIYIKHESCVQLKIAHWHEHNHSLRSYLYCMLCRDCTCALIYKHHSDVYTYIV